MKEAPAPAVAMWGVGNESAARPISADTSYAALYGGPSLKVAPNSMVFATSSSRRRRMSRLLPSLPYAPRLGVAEAAMAKAVVRTCWGRVVLAGSFSQNSAPGSARLSKLTFGP